jgi:hypothetical protein
VGALIPLRIGGGSLATLLAELDQSRGDRLETATRNAAEFLAKGPTRRFRRWDDLTFDAV